jgi:hypothetical protein
MSGMNFEELSPQERLIAEQAILNFRTLNKACREAPDGKVLDVAETLAIDQGRELTRRTLEASVNLEREDVEKKRR